MLKKYAKKIFALTIHEKITGEAVTLEKIKPGEQITIVPHAHTTKIIGDGNRVTAIEYRDSETGECQQIKVDGVFVEIGSVPNTKIFNNLIKLNRWNEIEVDRKTPPYPDYLCWGRHQCLETNSHCRRRGRAGGNGSREYLSSKGK